MTPRHQAHPDRSLALALSGVFLLILGAKFGVLHMASTLGATACSIRAISIFASSA